LRVEPESRGAEDLRAHKGNLRALVVAKLQPIGGEPGALSFEQTALAERAFTPGKPGELSWQAHAEHAIRDCVGGVGARVKLAAGDSGAIVAAIDGSDDDLRDEAMLLAGERKGGGGAGPFEAPEAHAARVARSALAPSVTLAVRPLPGRQVPSSAICRKVLDALATIGGPRRFRIWVRRQRSRQSEIAVSPGTLVHLDRRQAERMRDLTDTGTANSTGDDAPLGSTIRSMLIRSASDDIAADDGSAVAGGDDRVTRRAVAPRGVARCSPRPPKGPAVLSAWRRCCAFPDRRGFPKYMALSLAQDHWQRATTRACAAGCCRILRRCHAGVLDWLEAVGARPPKRSPIAARALHDLWRPAPTARSPVANWASKA
jgi:hypothetical protein